VAIASSKTLTGYVMVEQVKSIDYKSRKVKLIEVAADELLAEVLSILDACIY
jgi:mRNA interferase MazF